MLSGHATAEAVGLNATDFFCLNLLALGGPFTAGQLAQRTALTTGATTRMLDRLEERGFVRRDRSLRDRRQVRVEASGERQDDIDAALAAVRRHMYAVFQHYDADEVRVLMDYFARAAPALLAAVEELQAQQRQASTAEPGEGSPDRDAAVSGSFRPRSSASPGSSAASGSWQTMDQPRMADG